MKIVVNRALCDGNGNCAAAAPDYFLLDENDNLIVLQEKVESGDRARVEAAVSACPKNALSLSEP